MQHLSSVRFVTLVCALGVATSAMSVFAATARGDNDEPRWTATLRPVNTDRSSLTDTVREPSRGTARWTPGKEPGQSVVEISFSHGGGDQSLSWAILFGACGSASMAVLPVSSFPEIELNSVGTGRLTATLVLDFPTSGAYRLEVYRDRSGDRDTIVSCGSFKFSP